MTTFYKPFSLDGLPVPVIVYPMKGIEEIFDRTKSWVLFTHMQHLIAKHPQLRDCTFQIAIVWKDNVVMTDVWLFRQLENEAAGFTVDCMTFRGTKHIQGEGITASDGLIVLGREAELEESIRKSGQPLIEKYVMGKRPELPSDLQPEEEFFQ